MSGARREKGGDFCATQDTKEGWVLENVGGWSTSTSRVEPIEHASEKYPELRVVGTRSGASVKTSRVACFFFFFLSLYFYFFQTCFFPRCRSFQPPTRHPHIDCGGKSGRPFKTFLFVSPFVRPTGGGKMAALATRQPHH